MPTASLLKGTAEFGSRAGYLGGEGSDGAHRWGSTCVSGGGLIAQFEVTSMLFNFCAYLGNSRLLGLCGPVACLLPENSQLRHFKYFSVVNSVCVTPGASFSYCGAV